ncbi:DUF2218 domain-containing protein [Nocardia sp. CA2R105]|uniref:DUF2218 domain-containing protein n=1 Tax=Nocardia coffeae TaxID=2873381 RepID=UPI001CA69E91|nr:DUF2218 domain-containing protein [Nocardia coffeae]MBY8855020.1 DUF2218 domain-containing protein [Nocardia coffeae]
MPTLETRIPTGRPERYLRQFCSHATAMGSGGGHRMRAHGTSRAAHDEVRVRVEATDTAATVHLEPWGHCTLRAESGALLVRIDAAEATALQRLRDTITRDLERFGRGEFTVRWLSVTDPDA